MIEKRLNKFKEYGLFATQRIEKGQIVFTHDEWVEDERLGWVVVTLEDLNRFNEKDRMTFLKYCYDIDFGKMIGTLDPERIQHLSNYINHSCDPNVQFDMNDNLIARRDIGPGEELYVDYGTFIVNADQDFICGCGAERCRRHITKDDWKKLVDEYGYNFPTFMHGEIGNLLNRLARR